MATTELQSIYTPRFLAHVYDPLVVRFANRVTWRCPNRRLRDMYNDYVSGDHLDIGPGSGWYLVKCRFPSSHPKITVLDDNPHVLAHVRRRLRHRDVHPIQANITEPIDLHERTFTSIAMTHVLHCLPGPMPARAAVFDNAARMLASGGVLFGSTILGRGAAQSRLSQGQLDRMNDLGIFDNRDDTAESIGDLLADRFANPHVWTVGRVALFTAREPLPGAS